MNKIFKVIYSKTRHCYVVVSELAKSHVKSSHGNGGQQKAALTMSVLLALGAFTFAFGPANAEAADEKHYTEGQQYIGVYHTSDDTDNAENHQGGLVAKNQGALGVGAISIGVHAEAGTGTITIGNRLAPMAQDSVFIGSKYDAEGKVYKTASSKVVSIGANSNASGTGSVALGYGAEADVSNVSGTGENPDREHQSIAIGYGATAKQNNIALGAGSIATEKASTAKALYTDQDAPTSYVSVGSTVIENGKTTPTLRRITNVADGAADTDVATIAQLKQVADNKVAWKLTTAGDNANASTVSAGDTVDFSAAKDSKENGQATGKDHSNLTISKEKENGTNKVNMTVGLSDNVVLGQNVSGKGGSLDVYRAVGDASSDTETNENNQSYDQLGSHVRIDGSTVSVHYDNGTDSDARGAVLGIANDSYKDTDNATKTVSSPLGYVYLQDGRNYYYLHGAMHGDTNYQGRLAYDSSESGHNYIANLDDGIKFSGDTKKDEKAVTVDTKLDSNAANNTLSITGGADVSDTTKLTNGNIGVVATTNETDSTTGEVKKAGGLSIQLAKNLTGITSISSQTTSATTTTGAKIEFGTNGTTISGGDVNVSSNKITNLKDGKANTDAATVGQMNTAIGNAKTKYYSVNDKNSISFTPKTLPTVTGLADNSDNKGAKGMGSLASGFSTEADGILSTVGGSYSGVINQNGNVLDLRGATALSYGTFNINQNIDTQKAYSGVANSIVGQANATTDSNAAIIYGAGNTITNSYRDIDTSKFDLSKVKQDLAKKDAAAVAKDLQEAVPTSGGQVMVMGGGNNVESAYMSQVVGVGNTVKGNQVKNTKGEWVTDTFDTAIKKYDPEKSSQYNYVDGFSNEVINGKHDYIIGANNKLDGDSYDDNNAKPIKRSNKSNVVIGDNHALTGKKNNVIIGSADTEGTLTRASDAVIIGHKANATSDTGADNAVAIGLSATAGGGNAVTIGVNTKAGDNSITIGSESSAISGENIAIGRYAKVKGYEVTKAVALGQMANALVADGVAIGSDSIATVAGNSVEGYDPTTGQTSKDTTATWKATKAAVSIGTADGKVTRQINGVAAGTKETDAVNVAQLKKLAGMKANVDASNIGKNLKGADDAEKTVNENAWGDAIGTGSIADGNSQLVTGNTVYAYNKPVAEAGKTLNYVSKDKTTGQNLGSLDAQVKANADNIGTNKTNITQNAGDITKLKNLSNITNEGQKVIKNLSKDAVKVTAGDRVTVTSTEDKEAGTITYKVSANNDGTVAAGDQNLVSGDTVNTAITNAITNAGTATDTKLAGKANVDASNIGANLKGSDGKTAASASDITANEDAWGTAIGTGTIASTSGQLVTGKTVYGEVRPTADGTYIKTAKTTAANLTALDTQVGRNTTNISNLQNGEGFTDKGNTYIKNLAKGSIGMENGSHTTVSHRDANGVETYKVDVNVDGKVESGNKGIVDGGAVYSAIQDVKNQTSADLANKANVDASNLTPNNVTKWQEKLGNGKVESGNTGLVTGDTVFKAVDTKANRDGSNLTDKEADSFSEKIARGEVKAGENRAVSGDAVSQAISKVTGDMNTKLDGKANTSLDNITKDGQTVIKKLSQDAVQVKAGDDHITVDAKTDETTGNKTYTISAKDGKVASGDTGLISGGTLYNEVHVDKDGSYIKSGNTVGNNLSALDTGLKNTSSLIHTNTSGDTIHIGETSKATKVDVSSTDANGNKNGRVVTGVVTDAKDANSAANVGYVNGVTAANTQQIYRDMNNAYSRLDTNINRAAAGSNALAALHPLDFDPADKASFAVGYGHYRNANAAAVGAFYQPNANTMVNMGISLGNGDPGFNAGVSFKIGKGSAYNGVSKAEMAQTIHDQATEISAIKADDAAKDKRIDALEKENQEMKKQIQEILARLNG